MNNFHNNYLYRYKFFIPFRDQEFFLVSFFLKKVVDLFGFFDFFSYICSVRKKLSLIINN